MQKRILKRIRFIGCLIVCVSIFGVNMGEAQPKASLERQTLLAYEKSVQSFENSIQSRVSGEKPFLWIRSQDAESLNRVRRGETLIFKVDRKDEVPKGILHAWGVSAFFQGAKADDVLSLLLDYDRQKNVYPSVIDSRIIAKNGDTVQGFLKFKYKKAISVVLNTEHQARFSRLNQGRYFIRVASTRIAEVADFGKTEERELPVGEDHGFMWRLNTYWFIEPQSDGVFVECQSLTLSRSIPFGLSWLIRPFISSIPRDSLKELVEGTRKALQK